MKNKKIIKLLTLLFCLISLQTYSKATEKIEVDGLSYYYGFGVEKNYEKARKRLAASTCSTTTPLLLLIYINGDGLKRDYKQALKIWKYSVTKGNNSKDATMEYLYEIITDRMKHPNKQYKRLEYWDIAMTTIDINISMWVQNAVQKQKDDKIIAKIKKTMTPKQTKYFKNIEKYFAGIETNDADRAYALYMKGTIRVAMHHGTLAYLRERHQKRIHDFIINRKYPKISQKDFLQADKKLNLIYQKIKKINIKIYQDDNEPKFIKLTNDMQKYLKLSQRNWIKYRDNWVLLINSLNNNSDNRSRTISIKTIITKSRIEELASSVDRFKDI